MSGNAIASDSISTTYVQLFWPIARIACKAAKSLRRPQGRVCRRKIGPDFYPPALPQTGMTSPQVVCSISGAASYGIFYPIMRNVPKA